VHVLVVFAAAMEEYCLEFKKLHHHYYHYHYVREGLGLYPVP
jgi:hypothetical protein